MFDRPIIEEKEDITYEIQNPILVVIDEKSKIYFTIQELTASATAKKLGIDNTPTEEIKKHLQELIDFLNPIREKWGSGIRVSSGFRCKKLNDAVKGSPTSVHQIGYAADIVNVKGKYEDFEKFIVDYLKDKKFDQCIRERSKTSKWIHIGLYNNAHQQRKQIFNINVE